MASTLETLYRLEGIKPPPASSSPSVAPARSTLDILREMEGLAPASAPDLAPAGNEAAKQRAVAEANARLAEQARTLPVLPPAEQSAAEALFAREPGGLAPDDPTRVVTSPQPTVPATEPVDTGVAELQGPPLLSRRRQTIFNYEPPQPDRPPNAFRRGGRRGMQSLAATGAAFLGTDPAKAAATIAKQQSKIRAYPSSPAVQRFFKEGSFASFAAAPLEITGSIIAESLGQFVPVLGAAAASSVVGPVGPIATVGTGSFALEAGGKILETFAEKGVDLTDPAQIEAAFGNPELMAEVRKLAALKGVPIALFDAASMGIAGRLFAPVRKIAGAGGSTLRKAGGAVAGAGAEIGTQASMGMAGETAGELAAGEELNLAAIVAEGIAEIGTGPVEIATGFGARARAQRRDKTTLDKLREMEGVQPGETATPAPQAPTQTQEPTKPPPPVSSPEAQPPEAAPSGVPPAYTLGVDTNGKYIITLSDGERIETSTTNRDAAVERADQEVQKRGLTSEVHVIEVGETGLAPDQRRAKGKRLTVKVLREQSTATKDALLAKLEEIENRLLTDFYQTADKRLASDLKDYAPDQHADYTAGFQDGIRTLRKGRVTPGEFKNAKADIRKTGRLSGIEFRQNMQSATAAAGEGRAPISIEVRRPTGGVIRYRVRPYPDEINALRKRFASRPAGAYAMTRPEPSSSGSVMGDVAETRNAGAGVNYTDFVRDRVEGETRTEPIRRETVLQPLLKALGVPLYQGRIKGKKRLGFFRPRLEEVRIKRMSDIEVAAHEIAHLLDDRIPEIRKQWLPATNANKAIRDELRGVSYDASKIYEGFSEFVRLWSTQKNQARAKAPKFYDWFEDFVGRHETGPALRKAQTDMHAWYAQDAATRARSKIGTPPDINEHLNTFWDRFRQKVADDLHGIMEMERSLTGELAPVGAYETARLVRGKMALIEGALTLGAPVVKSDGSHSFEGKGLREILDPVAGNIDDALLYFVGKSAAELKGQGREHLFTHAEIKGMLELETPERVRAFKDYQTWNRKIVDFAEAKGIINPGFRAMWRRAQYLPFHRVGQPGPFQAVPGDWKGIRALTGGTDNIRDVLGNMIGNAATLIDAALTNEARAKVADLARGPAGAHFMAKIPTEERIQKIHRTEIERAILDALGVDKKSELAVEQQIFVDGIIANMDAFVPLIQRGQAPLGRNVIAVLRRGKPTYYEVIDPLLYRALTNLNRPAKNWLVRSLGAVRRLSQASITLSLDFITANIARDTLMGTIMSRHGFKPVLDSARGLASRITQDENYRAFVANGGGFSSYLVDESAFKTNLERFYRQRAIDFKTVLHTPAKLLLGLERIADAFEAATRLGEMRQALLRGEHPRHAAYSAREVSTDFGMRGDSATLGFAYDTIIFLKAAVNGIDRLYRGVAHDPNRAKIAAKTAALALASMALYALNRGNPLYDELEDWDRDTHWHVFIPTGKYYDFVERTGREPETSEEAEGLFEHFRFPKIWEIGAIASIAERSLGALLDDAGEYAESVARIIRNTFRFEYIPQAFAPLVENAMNRNRFLDRPIETEAEKSLQPWARSGAFTSRTLRAYGETVGRRLPKGFPEWAKSPKQVEALLRGYLNTWALYGLTLSDAAFFDNVPDLRVDQYPGLRRFYRKGPARNTRYVTKLYDAIEEAVQARRTMRFMDRTYRKPLADKLEFAPANLRYPQLMRARKEMGKFRREMALNEDAPTLRAVQAIIRERAFALDRTGTVARLRNENIWNDLGALKRWLADDLTRERNTFARDTVRDLRTAQPVPALSR